MKLNQKLYESLLNLREQGGENSLDDSITASFDASNTLDYVGFTHISIKGVIFPQPDLLRPTCLSPSCIDSQGIWTTALTSDKSILLGGTTYYWIQGAVDSNGGAWIADMGYLSLKSYAETILDTNLPISAIGDVQSEVPMPRGIKIAILKRVTRFRVETIQYVIGSSSQTLIRSSKGSVLPYTYAKQKTNLSTLSLGLLSLLDEDYTDQASCRQIFGNDPTDPTVSQIITNSNSIIFNLLDPTPTGRSGSIIHNLPTYITPSLIFGFNAESLYKNPDVVPIDPSCLSDTCIDCGSLADVLVNRAVSNVSISWLIIYAAEYIKLSTDKSLIDELVTLGNYLINQIDIGGFLYEGWTDASPLSKSEVIADTSLEVNVVGFCALLKLFEITGLDLALEKSLLLKDYIMTNLYISSTQLFKENPYTGAISIKSYLYGLIFSCALSRWDIAQSIYQYLFPSTSNATLTSFQQVVSATVGIDDSSEPVIDTTSTTPTSIFYLSPGETYSEEEQDVMNCLYIEVFSYLNEQVTIKPLTGLITDLIINSRRDYTILSIASYLKGNSLISRIVSPEIRYLNVLDSSRYRLYDLAVSFYPTNYSWASPKALTVKGNLGKLILSLTRPVALLYALTMRTINTSSLDKVTGYSLDTFALHEYNLIRRVRETDETFKARIKRELSASLLKCTKPSLIQRLSDLNFLPIISERYEQLATYSYIYSNNTTEGNYLQGPEYTNSVVDIEINGPSNQDVYNELKQGIPIATKYLLTQAINLSPCNDAAVIKDYLLIESVNTDASFVLLEDGISYALDEVGCPIKLEDQIQPPLAAPSNLSLSISCSPPRVNLSWTASSTHNAVYLVKRSNDGGAVSLVTLTSTTNAVDPVIGTNISYEVLTVDPTQTYASSAINATITYTTQCSTPPTTL